MLRASVVRSCPASTVSLSPPFDASSARRKVKLAQALWNTKDPESVSKAYTPDTIWRNRDKFLRGREEVVAFLKAKWAKEQSYRLRKELFSFSDSRIAVQFWYEYHDLDSRSWHRCYGLEHWTFVPNGKMRKRQMSGNDIAITEAERWFPDHIADVDTVEIDEKHW